MKLRSIKIFVVFVCVFGLTAEVSAASSSRSIFKIDFDFVVKDEQFPAGKYSVERLSPANPEILVLKRVGEKSRSVLLIQKNGGSKLKKQLKLQFKQTGGTYVLVGIQIFGERYARDATLKETRRDSETLSFVMLPDIFGAA